MRLSMKNHEIQRRSPQKIAPEQKKNNWETIKKGKKTYRAGGVGGEGRCNHCGNLSTISIEYEKHDNRNENLR